MVRPSKDIRIKGPLDPRLPTGNSEYPPFEPRRSLKIIMYIIIYIMIISESFVHIEELTCSVRPL